jgi:hypothetical protein
VSENVGWDIALVCMFLIFAVCLLVIFGGDE